MQRCLDAHHDRAAHGRACVVDDDVHALGPLLLQHLRRAQSAMHQKPRVAVTHSHHDKSKNRNAARALLSGVGAGVCQ